MILDLTPFVPAHSAGMIGNRNPRTPSATAFTAAILGNPSRTIT